MVIKICNNLQDNIRVSVLSFTMVMVCSMIIVLLSTSSNVSSFTCLPNLIVQSMGHTLICYAFLFFGRTPRIIWRYHDNNINAKVYIRKQFQIPCGINGLEMVTLSWRICALYLYNYKTNPLMHLVDSVMQLHTNHLTIYTTQQFPSTPTVPQMSGIQNPI